MKYTLLSACSAIAITAYVANGTAYSDKNKAKCSCGDANQDKSQAKDAKTIQGWVCPRFMYMDWGGYYSYYAERGDAEPNNGCDQVNMDSTSMDHCLDGDCEDNNNQHCQCSLVRFRKNSRSIAIKDLGKDGYGSPKLSKWFKTHTQLPRPEGLPPGHRDIELEHNVPNVNNPINMKITYTTEGGDEHYIFAQVFIMNAKKTGAAAFKTVGRGSEVLNKETDPTNKDLTQDERDRAMTDGLATGDVRPAFRFDVTKGPDRQLSRKPGELHVFIYKRGMLEVPIITHEKTPGHDKK
jgi:hypothetical protein